MERNQIPLNALRAFEASARHLNFTRAGLELRVSQGAVSHQVAQLEQRLGKRLFHRLPRGLALTDEGAALMPTISDAFDRMGATLDRFIDGRFQDVLNVGVVGTFATGWLLDRLEGFCAANPEIDLRISTNNNRPDLAGEALDYAIRFGDGAWHGTHAEPLMTAPLSVLCAPALAAHLQQPQDVAQYPLLRSYRGNEWARWFAAAGCVVPPISGTIFDSSVLMAAAATKGQGMALVPPAMFTSDCAAGRLVQPFPLAIDSGQYWLTRLISKEETAAMRRFREWLIAEASGQKLTGS